MVANNNSGNGSGIEAVLTDLEQRRDAADELPALTEPW